MSVDIPIAAPKRVLKDFKADLHNDWCPGCLAPDTQIFTKGGVKGIADIAVDDMVLAHDGKYHRVTETMSHEHPAPMHRLAVGLGHIVLTPDHPVYLRRAISSRAFLDFEWVRADEVQLGDEMVLPGRPFEISGVNGISTVRDISRESGEASRSVATLNRTAEEVVEYILSPVIENTVIEYDGMVHNFEVEDVHSYVTSIGALHNCGDFGILTGIQMAFAQLNLDPDKVAVFSGIGCSGKTPHYIKTYGFHTLHGRVLPVATGGRLANSDITVVAVGGDGDGYGIGAGYFVNSGRRNVDFTYLVHTNQVYGLTKGQASPTLSRGRKTKSMPEQAIQDGINPIAMAVAAGYTFIARAYALEPKYLASIIVRAIQHRGSALVDVLQTCPTYNDLYTKEWYEGADLPEKRSRLYKLDEQGYDGKVQDPTDVKEITAKKAAAVGRSYENEPIPIGVYYEIELPTYEDGVNQRIPALAEKPLVDIDTFNRDVTPLLEAMR